MRNEMIDNNRHFVRDHHLLLDFYTSIALKCLATNKKFFKAEMTRTVNGNLNICNSLLKKISIGLDCHCHV
jgi:hypothetical protein